MTGATQKQATHHTVQAEAQTVHGRKIHHKFTITDTRMQHTK